MSYVARLWDTLSYIAFLLYTFVAWCLNTNLSSSIVGRDSSIGIAARYGLAGPGIDSR